MGIQVECPHGHVFKVKDKYAGKRGLCPHCKGQVVVLVPDAYSSGAMQEAYRKAIDAEQHAAHASGSSTSHDDSIFDDVPKDPSAETSGSLLGSSVIRHHVRCDFCNQSVPMWYAKCPSCGHFLENG